MFRATSRFHPAELSEKGLSGKSNQTNVYSVDALMLHDRDAREVDLREPTSLVKPPDYMPLLQWIRRELERAEDEYDDALMKSKFTEVPRRCVLMYFSGVRLQSRLLPASAHCTLILVSSQQRTLNA
jgi:hypothetical protein